jgi:hypothetical protein
MVKKKMHSGFRFLRKGPRAALYITKPKPSLRLWGWEGPPLERGSVENWDYGQIVNVCQVTKHPWGGRRNNRKFRSAL